MNVIYSFNKHGREAEIWHTEIASASSDFCRFVPFNHDPYLDYHRYVRAQLLDELYFRKEPGLMRMYDDLMRWIETSRADVLVVDNMHPYHPEFLRRLPLYKVIRTSDGPLAAYDRDFAYVHAYDHVLFHSPAYSEDLTMAQKLAYVGAKKFDFWPLALFDAAFDPAKSKRDVLASRRDIDVIFIGSLYLGKMPILARLKKALGKRMRIYGLTTLKKNLYFNMRYRFPGWVKPINFCEYVSLYERAKLGINLHNRGKYTVGNFRLFELPANGVLQISDGGEYLGDFFAPGSEIISCGDTDCMLEKIEYFLTHENERVEIASASYDAVMARHRFRYRMQQLFDLLAPHVSAR